MGQGCCCKLWGGSHFGEPPWLSSGMLLHFPFTLWEGSRGFLSAKQEFCPGRERLAVQSAVEKPPVAAVTSHPSNHREAAPAPGSTQRDAVEFLQPRESPAGALKAQKAAVLLAGFGGGASAAAGRFRGERGARGEKLCGFEVLVWSK